MSLAVFDFDNTIIQGQSQLYLLRYALRHRRIKFLDGLKVLLWFSGYKLGIVKSPEGAVAYSYRKMLRGKTEAEISTFLQQFNDDVLRDRQNKIILSVLKNHQAKNDTVVIISNALKPLVALVAKDLGISKIIATNPEKINGVYTGNLDGELIYGENKVNVVIGNFPQSEIVNGYAYADHYSDLSLLKIFGHPVAVNPDKKLLEFAKLNNWQVI